MCVSVPVCLVCDAAREIMGVFFSFFLLGVFHWLFLFLYNSGTFII